MRAHGGEFLEEVTDGRTETKLLNGISTKKKKKRNAHGEGEELCVARMRLRATPVPSGNSAAQAGMW